jgi:site-specific DNA recombinase
MTINDQSAVRVAIYARVSSEQQAQEQTIASQVAALRQRVAADGFELPEELCFLDEGVSGTTLRRPALERLRDAAYVGGFQKLYVHSPDRLSRRYAYQVLVVDELAKHGVEITFLNRAIGVSPEEDLLLQMQGMFAEYERAKIMERSRRGKRHAATGGSVNVLSGAPYGYRYVSKRDGQGRASYEIHEEHAAVVKQMFEWVGRDRLSIGEVSRRLKEKGIVSAKGKSCWDRTSVWGILKNPAYSGSAAFGKTRMGPRRTQLRKPRGQAKIPRRTGSTYDTQAAEQIMIAVPAIVSTELFASVQEQLTENRLRGRERRRGAKYLLQGLLECQCCGYAYYGKPVSRSSAQRKVPYAYYRCVGTDAYRFGGQRVCQNSQVRTDKLDQAVWNDACELLRNPQLLRKEYERRLAAPESSDTERSLQKQLATIQRTMNRLIDIHADGLIGRDEFEPRLAHARHRHAELESKLESLRSQSREQTALREALACVESFSETVKTNLDQADWTTRREILRTLIDRVVIEPAQVRIVYRINFPLFARSASTGKVLHFCWRSDRGPLRAAPTFVFVASRAMHMSAGTFLLDRRDQPELEEMQYGFVADATGHALHQLGVRDRIKITRQISIHHFRIAGVQQPMHRLHGVERTMLGPIGELLRLQVGLEDRFQHDQERRLHDAVLDRWNAQRPLLAVRFGNVHTTHRLRLVRLGPEFFRQFFQPLRLAVLLDVRKRLVVYARLAAIVATSAESHPEHIFAVHLVVQRVEAELGFSLRFGMQRCLQLLNRR